MIMIMMIMVMIIIIITIMMIIMVIIIIMIIASSGEEGWVDPTAHAATTLAWSVSGDTPSDAA